MINFKQQKSKIMERIVTDPVEKQWGMFTHLAALSGLLGIPFGGIIGPLIIYLIKKDFVTETLSNFTIAK